MSERRQEEEKLLKVNYEGREYEFVGYNTSQEATHYLDPDGNLREKMAIFSIRGTAWFRLVLVRHTIAGVVFEETGETRHAQPDEWWWDETNQRAFNQSHRPTIHEYPILKPVEIRHD